ncbi:MAG: hypothetical protein OEU95_03145, partial [Nitrospirota bacterium]|nr:hypothetical protein [Nitrospirota bacterium]
MNRKISKSSPEITGTHQFCETTPEKVNIEPFTMVVFGGTGDLSRRKLLPTLYHLCKDQNLPQEFSIIGFASGKRSDDEYRKFVLEAIEEFGEDDLKKECWEGFSRHLFYVSGGFEDEEGYRELARRIDENTRSRDAAAGNIIYYLATPPHYLSAIFERLPFCKPCGGMINPRV